MPVVYLIRHAQASFTFNEHSHLVHDPQLTTFR